jgi:iron complex outermembrane receptor protein
MLASRRALTLSVAFTLLFTPVLASAQTDQQNQAGTPSGNNAAPAAPEPASPTAAPAPAAPADQPAADQPADVTAQPTGKSQKFGEEIVVTGSRIRRKDLTTPAPVTVLSREQVQASGKVSIGDFLQSLPEQGNAINTSVNNGGDGSTRVALRGLGVKRTLVLLNGRRMVPGGTGADDSVDLNSIPSAAIERIEVLKDGASAVYGSDAIGGVINVITRKRYNGTEVSGYSGITTHGDGTLWDVNATTGTGGDRGNILFSAGMTRQQPVGAGARDFAATPVIFDATANPGQQTSGSGTIPGGRFITDGAGGGNACWQALTSKFGDKGSFTFDPKAAPVAECGGLTYRPYKGSALTASGDGYNFQPLNYLVTPQQRIQLFSTGDTKFAEAARGYFEASYVNRTSQQKLAPEPLVLDGIGVAVSKDNIYNPFGRDFDPNTTGAGVRRRLAEFGNREFTQDIDTFRVVGGIDGTLPDNAGPLKGWFWDLSLNYGRVQGTQLTQGDLRTNRIADAVGPSMLVNGTPTCVRKAGDPTTAITGCVPLDLFHGPGSITKDQVTGLSFTGTQRGVNQLTSFQATTSGELFSLFADRPVGLAVGYEFRRLLGTQLPDPITNSGENSDQNIASTSGGYNVHEGYGELSVPVVNHLPFAESVEATVAARVFDYSTFGSDWTYKLGARWSIIPDVTLRGTVSTAFRAPTIADLFLGQQENFAPVSDPCAGINPSTGAAKPVTGTLAARCGAAANNGDTTTQLRSFVGGNPNLQPEKANIFTVGVVLEPTMIRGLTLTADYYNVRIFQTIPTGGIGEATILNGCYNPDPSVPQKFCNLINRNPGSQRILNLVNTNQNVGKDLTDGVDVAARYAIPTRQAGRFQLIFDGTFLHKYDRLLADGTLVHGRGTFDLNNSGTGGVYPVSKFNAGVVWGMGPVGAGVSTKFVGSFKECGTSAGLFDGTGLCYVDDTFQRKVSAYNTYDAFVSYNLTTGIGRTNFGVGVLNAFDKKPSVIYNGFTAASDPTAYDFLGRFVYFRLTQSI